jgi:NarL family two-component system sensor histidine kinase LiaS
VLPSALGFVLIAVLTGTIFGLLTARGFTRRFRRLAEVVDNWSQGDFSSFVVDTSTDEIGQLARRLNRMAEQLQHLLRTREQLATLDERNRLARDLHDSVKQQVFAVALQLSTAKSLLGPGADAARSHLSEAEHLVHQAQQELTTLLRALVAAWSQQTGITATFEMGDDEDGAPALPLAVEQVLYRIAQEALANVARHSGATAVQVRLAREEGAVSFAIADNGGGFDLAAANGHGMGLRSMRERAAAVDSNLDIQSAPGAGTVVTVRCEPNAVGGVA